MNSAKYLFTLLSVLVISALNAQKLNISNVTVSSSGQVSFSAIIEKNNSDRERYEMSVYSSADNYLRPLNVKFNNLEPGTSHQLSFNGNQVGEFDGNIQFKFEISASIFPIRIDETSSSRLKQGKNFQVNWLDFSGAGPYKVELFKGSALQQVLESSYSGTSYTGLLPASIEKGENYSIRVTPTSDSNLASEPYDVIVKGALPLAVKLAPIAAAGAAGVIFALSGSSGGGNGDDFPNVPETPDGS